MILRQARNLLEGDVIRIDPNRSSRTITKVRLVRHRPTTNDQAYELELNNVDTIRVMLDDYVEVVFE